MTKIDLRKIKRVKRDLEIAEWLRSRSGQYGNPTAKAIRFLAAELETGILETHRTLEKLQASQESQEKV